MREQLPVFGSVDGVGAAAIALLLLVIAVLSYGRVAGRGHVSSRFAMVVAAAATYLGVVSTAMPYVASRSLLSLIAFGLIFGARFVRRLRPVKTVLFFIGVAFTCEALAWSLADETATVTGFSIFTVMALFFTCVDKKRAFKTSCFALAGSLVVLASVVQLGAVSLGVAAALIACAVAAFVWHCRHLMHVRLNALEAAK